MNDPALYIGMMMDKSIPVDSGFILPDTGVGVVTVRFEERLETEFEDFGRSPDSEYTELNVSADYF